MFIYVIRRAKLTPSSLPIISTVFTDEINCGNCQIAKAKKCAEDKGYKVFIVPGSTFIKRLVRKHKPKAMASINRWIYEAITTETLRHRG